MSGAGLGGYLAEPYSNLPLFGKIRLFEQFPYTLPGIAGLGCSLLTCLVVTIILPEVSLQGPSLGLHNPLLRHVDQQTLR